MIGRTLHRAAISAAAATLCLAVAAAVQAAPRIEYKPVKNHSSVRVDGTSTLHDWTVKSKQINGNASFPARNVGGKLQPALDAKDAMPQFNVIIPVAALTSGESGMDDVMFDAMGKSKYPIITYKLTKSTFKSSDAKKQAYGLDTIGRLTIHGVTRTIRMPFTVTRLPNDRLAVSGKINLEMTSFKIDPPSAMLGIIRSGNKVTVTVRWLLKRAKSQFQVSSKSTAGAAQRDPGALSSRSRGR